MRVWLGSQTFYC